MQSMNSVKSYLETIHVQMDKFSKKIFGKPRSTLVVKFANFNGNTKQKTETADQHYATLSRNVTQIQKFINEFNSQNPNGNQILQKKLLQQLDKCSTQIKKIQQLKKFTRSQVNETDLENHLEILQIFFGKAKSSFAIMKQIDSNLEKKLQSQKRNSLQKNVPSPIRSRRYKYEQHQRANSASNVRSSQLRLNEINKQFKRVQNNLIHEQAQGEESNKSSGGSSEKKQKRLKNKKKVQQKPQTNNSNRKTSQKQEQSYENPKQVEHKLMSENQLLKQQNIKLKKQLEQLISQQKESKYSFSQYVLKQLEEEIQSQRELHKCKIQQLTEKVKEEQEKRKQVEVMYQQVAKRLKQMETQGKLASGEEKRQPEDADLIKVKGELAQMKKDLVSKSKTCENLSTENTSLKARINHYEMAFSQFSQQFTKNPFNPPT